MVTVGTPFFGIGAMRAGTTWLSDVLETYADCKMTPFKEIHFFDVRHGKYGGDNYYRSMAKRLATLGGSAAKRILVTLNRMEDRATSRSTETDDDELRGRSKAWSDDVRSQFLAGARLGKILPQMMDIMDVFSVRDVDSYVDYLKRNTVGAAAFGEITPAYGLLPAAGFAEMDRALPDARFIFIMRDPVERLWSHARYKAGIANKRGRKQIDPNVVFRNALQGTAAIGRSNYHRTIEELESVVPADRILYLFYETMTSPETGPAEIRRIEYSLGLGRAEIDPKIFASPVNASPPAKLDPQQEAAAIRLFQPVYAFVEKRFGRQSRWRSAVS